MKSKAEVRAEARVRLVAMADEERRANGAAIARRIWDLTEIADASVLMLYASLPAEVATDEIAAEAWRRGIEVVYPRCVPATRAMSLHRVVSPEGLRMGAYGIREPSVECPNIGAGDVDAVLMPGLAWDRQGNRLGRGAGYYDRLLARREFRAFTCGVFFAQQEFVQLPTDHWDIPLSAIVTEKEAYRPDG